jgi:hypothetical protein
MAIPTIIIKPFKNKSLNRTKILNEIIVLTFFYLNSLYFDYYEINITYSSLKNSDITPEET